MADVFLYGSLRDAELLEIVLGRPAGAAAAAALPGHEVRWAETGPFPVIRPAPGACAEGLLLRGLDAAALARLDFYEGGFGYAARPVRVESSGASVPALCYFPQGAAPAAGEAWGLKDWQARWGALSREAAREVMALRGTKAPEEIARLFPMIRARAAARVTARQGTGAANPGGLTARDVALEALRQPYTEYFAVREYDLRFRRHDGTFGPVVRRAAMVMTDVVVVLPYDPVRDRVLVVEQFRIGPYGRGDPNPWQLEGIAGRLDPGERPETCAHREAWEEARLVLRGLEPVATCYPSPGAVTEFYNVFVGLADLPDGAGVVAGLESEAEDIRGHVMDFGTLLEMADRRQLAAEPLLLAVFWLARHRARLRAG